MLALIASVMAILIWVALSPDPDGVIVLEYHKVDSEDTTEGYAYNVPPADFSEQLDYLQANGYTTITMLEYMKARKGKLAMPEKPIILTFDDGYEDNYTTMLPLLEQHNMKAVMYMVTNDIGHKGYLSWEQLRDMQNRGVEIGSHTANHLPLTELDRAKQLEEMQLSKLLMEWNGIKTVFSFSYPNGAYDEAMPAMLAKSEYLTAVTGDAGYNTVATNNYLLQRTNIPHPRLGLTEFKLRLFKAKLMTKLGISQHTAQ